MCQTRSPFAVRTVALLTLGYKLNQADSEVIARELAAAGCRVLERPAPADAFVVNTCSVTHVADRKSRHLVRLARRLAPEACVVLTGCFVETAGPEWAPAIGADVALGNREKGDVVAALLGSGGGRTEASRPGEGAAAAPLGRTRAFVKVQEGCNDVCAFCVVPRSRGRERSRPIDEVVAAVAERQAEGAQEIVLTGTQIGAYGRDLGKGAGLVDLIEALLVGTAVPRLRLSSLQLRDIAPELLRLWEERRLCRHFHLAIQSGSDAVLRRMRRRYTADGFRRSVALIRERVEDVAITTDVLVGFPGETDADFEETEAFCRETGFADLHVFPYSRRAGTAASGMPEQVPEATKRRRAERMLELARESRRAYLERFAGRTMPVLWERSRCANGGSPVWEGLTDNYIRVFVASRDDLRNRLLPARLVWAGDDGFQGELLA